MNQRPNALDPILEQFETFGAKMAGSTPLYAGLATHLATRPDIADILLAHEDPNQRIPVLLFGAVHQLVLTDPSLPLAAWYQTVNDDVRTDDPFDTFATTCQDHRDAIESIVARREVQTNDVGRCAMFAPALSRLPGPVGLIDVGTSAGLNLYLDRYRIDYTNGSVGPNDSRVRIGCKTNDEFPTDWHTPTIGSRVGVDQNPLDVTDPDDALWLRACVWPDQPERFERLSEASVIAANDPPVLAAGDAIDDVARLVIETPEFVHPVVMTSWVLNYIERRAEFVDRLRAAAAGRDVSWVWAESPAFTPGLPWPDASDGADDDAADPLTHLMLTTWRDGTETTERLALCHPHGTRIEWVSDRPPGR